MGVRIYRTVGDARNVGMVRTGMAWGGERGEAWRVVHIPCNNHAISTPARFMPIEICPIVNLSDSECIELIEVFCFPCFRVGFPYNVTT